MPLLNVAISGAPDAALSASVAEELTRITNVCLHKEPSLTAVVINYVADEDWAIGGRPLIGLGVRSFSLEIKVTAATNTKAEMAAYLEAVSAAMGQLIGELHETSYIIVHEVAAAAWGFGGKSQEHRFVAGRIGQAA
jgi:4-oxalocrotonate tautomerase